MFGMGNRYRQIQWQHPMEERRIQKSIEYADFPVSRRKTAQLMKEASVVGTV